MAAITMQRDLVLEMKEETVLNVGTLSKLHGLPQDISRQVLKDNALEKLTQNIFNHLTYYFVCIIDPKASEAFCWPLYDSSSERKYRNALASFISSYSSKGLLSPVMASYLVNPNCYKVTLLLFQMSQLAVQKFLESKMKKDSQRNLCNEMTAKYKSQEKDRFIEHIEKETKMMQSKFTNYLQKRKVLEIVAEKFRTKITDIESKLATVNAQKYLDDLVDGFISKSELDVVIKEEILMIKNVHKPAPFFDWWLTEEDRNIDELDSKWSEKMTPFEQLCKQTKLSTELLIARHTGEAEKETYMIEYNHKTDEICTKELQNQVNSQQKYILKNIVRDGKLNFPNLIRGFLIAIGFVLKGVETGDEIYRFNECLEGGKRNYSEVVETMRELIKRVVKAEAQLAQPSPVNYHVATRDFPEIPPLPDLSGLRCTVEVPCQALFDSFTPMRSKHQFNLGRRSSLHTFVRPAPKSLLTPFQAPKTDFLKNLMSCPANSDLNATQNFHNLSIIPRIERPNETIAGSSTGCTKEQLMRLLSTRKSSSSKKFKHINERSVKIKKARLFSDTISPCEISGLVRSYSSPNLYENRELRSIQRSGRRKLSIMEEGSPSPEVSGIIALDKDSSTENSRNQSHKKSFRLPEITLTSDTPPADEKFQQNLKDFNIDLNKEFLVANVTDTDIEKVVTPQNNPKLTFKTRSLEKIINRYKKIRETMLHDCNEKSSDFRTISEEKENYFTANRILLPDLLSPSCSVRSISSDDLEVRRPRESLGTALGVDNTFLDQFDLID